MEKLKARRKALNLTQANLAVQVGTTQNTIWRLENGRLKPSLELLKRISIALNCTIDSLL